MFSIATYAIETAMIGSTILDGTATMPYHAQAEGDRVRDRECGRLLQDRARAAAQQVDAEHEQHVIESVRHDVRESESEVAPGGAGPGGRRVGSRQRNDVGHCSAPPATPGGTLGSGARIVSAYDAKVHPKLHVKSCALLGVAPVSRMVATAADGTSTAEVHRECDGRLNVRPVERDLHPVAKDLTRRPTPRQSLAISHPHAADDR